MTLGPEVVEERTVAQDFPPEGIDQDVDGERSGHDPPQSLRTHQRQNPMMAARSAAALAGGEPAKGSSRAAPDGGAPSPSARYASAPAECASARGVERQASAAVRYDA